MSFFQLQPLSNRFLGFDRLFSDLERAASAASTGNAGGFPPYNLYREDDGYTIEVALAGYRKENVFINHNLANGVLTIGGNTGEPEDGASLPKSELITCGIANRSFVRTFTLADDMEVQEAEMSDGLLKVKLKKLDRKPDTMISVKIK